MTGLGPRGPKEKSDHFMVRFHVTHEDVQVAELFASMLHTVMSFANGDHPANFLLEVEKLRLIHLNVCLVLLTLL